MNELFNPFNSYFHQFGVCDKGRAITKTLKPKDPIWNFYDVTEDGLKQSNKMYFIQYTEERA